jgi:hypothetical protein
MALGASALLLLLFGICGVGIIIVGVVLVVWAIANDRKH